MKNFLLTLFTIITFALPLNASAGSFKYIIDPSHANVIWSANHFGFSNVYGRFDDVQGSLFFDPENPTLSNVKVIIKTASLDTAVPKLTRNLKGEDFFNVEQFPEATFVSTNIKVSGKNYA